MILSVVKKGLHLFEISKYLKSQYINKCEDSGAINRLTSDGALWNLYGVMSEGSSGHTKVSNLKNGNYNWIKWYILVVFRVYIWQNKTWELIKVRRRDADGKMLQKWITEIPINVDINIHDMQYLSN